MSTSDARAKDEFKYCNSQAVPINVVVIDTHMGWSSDIEMCSRLLQKNSSQCTKSVVENGLLTTGGFLPAMEAPELVMQCINHYNPAKRFVEKEGRVYVDLSQKGIIYTFGPPIYT